VQDKATGRTENLPKQYGEGFSTYKYQLEAFVKAVKSGNNKDVINSIPGWVPGEDSIANMKVIDEVYTRAGMKLRE
jgi:predicted dehydrogenase